MIYRNPAQHELDVPRRGDLAEVLRSHCIQESGRLIQVMSHPLAGVGRCAHCGSEMDEFFVEVHCSDSEWQGTPGPWFMPVQWLKRLDPMDPVQYARLRKYRYVVADEQQLRAANS